MQLNQLFKASALATAIALAGCGGGDIVITEGNIDNSVVDNSVVNNGTTDGGNGSTPVITPVVQPGDSSSVLSNAVSDAFGRDVTVRILSGVLTPESAGAEDGVITLTNDTVWALEGPLFVGEDKASSVTLAIEEGTVIFGRSGGDYLVVSRDSKIEALGTAAKPIVMTSYQDVIGEETSAGQWGGVVILGNGISNKCPADGTACALQVEGVEEGAVFGGTDNEDNSGTLKYVVVKNAGYEVAPDNELNGVTFGAVGSGTTVDYLQVHANADDGVEFFGGAVNVKHLVLTGNKDDSIDWDNGYVGKLQHIFVAHDSNSGEANRIIEADNDGSNLDKEPRSLPTIANMTAIGNNFDTQDKDSEGVYLREGTGAHMYNVVVTGPTEMGECFEVENSTETQRNTTDGTIKIENSALACKNGENFKNVTEQWFLDQTGNVVLEAPGLDENGVPTANSPVLGSGQDISNTVDAFFDSTNYMGAFDGSTDWRSGWAWGFGGGQADTAASGEVVAASCPTGTVSITSVDGSTLTCELSGVITSDVTLTAGNFYALSGPVFVGNDNADRAKLTIEAGVTLFGREGGDYLVVSRGSEIAANGTSAKPIVMTSKQDVTGEATSAGQWGGVILLGNAPSNKCPADGTACALQVEGAKEGAVFGGTIENDSSGVLRYVVVKHAGFEIAPDNELNGITFGGVGSGTTVEYIQVHENADDGIEFFGGSVNVKYVVLTANKDDSVDWDNGFKGKLQYVLVKHANDNGEANRAIEADNDGSNPDKQPQSNPSIANMTIIGNGFDTADKDSEGVYLREGTLAQLSNFVITGPQGMGECFEVENTDFNNANVAEFKITMTNSVMACENGENFKNVAESWFTGQTGNAIADNQAAVLDGIYTIFDGTAKDFSSDTFFDNVDFIGAVDKDNDWTAGWAVGLE